MKQAVLVVESHDLARNSLCEFLRNEGYDVHPAANILAGNKLAREIRFDVVLSDVMLPGAEGVMMLKRSWDAIPNNSRLIVMTAEATAEAISEMERMGVQYVRKPILFDDLIAVLGEVART